MKLLTFSLLIVCLYFHGYFQTVAAATIDSVELTESTEKNSLPSPDKAEKSDEIDENEEELIEDEVELDDQMMRHSRRHCGPNRRCKEGRTCVKKCKSRCVKNKKASDTLQCTNEGSTSCDNCECPTGSTCSGDGDLPTCTKDTTKPGLGESDHHGSGLLGLGGKPHDGHPGGGESGGHGLLGLGKRPGHHGEGGKNDADMNQTEAENLEDEKELDKVMAELEESDKNSGPK